MATVKSVDASLWWDPFSSLLTELENVALSSDLPPNLVKKLNENRAWLVDAVSRFKPPNAKSREALSSQQLKIGSHELTVRPELKERALEISPFLGLDEVQTYILVERSSEHGNSPFDSVVPEFLQVVLVQYYIERQCLLKCTRRILTHALCIEDGSSEHNAIREEVQELISAGLDSKLISLLGDHLSSTHPEQMDIDLFTLWAEEILNEDNLVLDILFLTYYEPFCICNSEKWKKLCLLYKGILIGSCNFGKLAVSAEALDSSHHSRVRLLLILAETLDLESLLQMVHDGTPFRLGALAFSLSDIQEMDAIISSLNSCELKDAGPLYLTWAVFICLITSLSGKEDISVLMDIDHVGYVRQAFQAASLNYIQEVLQNDILRECEGPFAGYRSVVRTLISAFIASYEINSQLEDSTLNLILDILCKVYRGEESLCMQFWDKQSFIDGPIRCLLCNVEGEFPYKTMELLRFLSSLCEGKWPAECVYNFLDKSVGISTLFEITNESLVDDASQTVETVLPLPVPGLEGLVIPSKSRGNILRVLGGNTVLVRWEYTESGVFILLMLLAQHMYLDRTEECFLILDLLNRMVSHNTGISFALMNLNNSLFVQPTGSAQVRNVWVVEVISSLVRKLYPCSSSAAMTSMGVNILAKMLKCSPSNVAAVALKVNMFEMASVERSSASDYSGPSRPWFLSGTLAKMLNIDCEQNDEECPLTVSVLEFAVQLVESGSESEAVHALLIFSLQYILVNHEYWKYKVRRVRWGVTLKVFELVRKCIEMSSYSKKLGDVIQDLLLNDSSTHSTLFRIVCTTSQDLEQLYTNRLVDMTEIEGLQLAIYSALDTLYIILSKFSKDNFSGFSLFHQAMLSSTTKPFPVAAALMSLMSFTRNAAIQVAAARVLSLMFIMANNLQQYLSGIACFSVDEKQVTEFKHSIEYILLVQSAWDEPIFLATVSMLTSAARFQPAFLLAVVDVKEVVSQPVDESSTQHRSIRLSIIDALLQYVERSDEVIRSNPDKLLTVLNFLKVLWEGAAQYTLLLERAKSSENFWKWLSSSVSYVVHTESSHLKTSMEEDPRNRASSFHCQAAVLEIMAYDIFLQRKLSNAEFRGKQDSGTKGTTENSTSTNKLSAKNQHAPADILLSWSKSSALHSLVKLYSSCEHDTEIETRAKVAASSFMVHVMAKLADGDGGPLSLSLLGRITAAFKELKDQPAFSELLSQYLKRGYSSSEGNELVSLILNDFYYQLQGELEGRKISTGPFKELFVYLLGLRTWQSYQQKSESNFSDYTEDIYSFDTARLRADINLDLWDYSNWKASKAIGETMLQALEDANSMMLLSRSKLSALKALTTILTVYEDVSLDGVSQTGKKIPDKLVFSSIEQVCRCLKSTLEPLAPTLKVPDHVSEFLAAQAELVIHLMQQAVRSPSTALCVLIFKTAGSALKLLNGIIPAVTGTKATMKLVLTMILLALEFSCSQLNIGGAVDIESVEDSADLSYLCLGHLPILCHCLLMPELCSISLITVDLILRSFLTPTTWFPIVKEHLPLQNLVFKLQDKNSPILRPIVLKFFLTLARVRGGAEMLLGAGFFQVLRALFSTIDEVRNIPDTSDKTEESTHSCGLGLAVMAAIIRSLGDSSSCLDIVKNDIPYFFSEKALLVSRYLDPPDSPFNGQKRPRGPRTKTSLTALRETEYVLMLMCVGAKYWSSWVKAMKEMDSQLREKCIHLLAFISRRFGESPSNGPLLCPPSSREEAESCKKPSIFNCKRGWFALSPLGCNPGSKSSAVTTATTALIVKDHAISTTYFSDTVALQMYKIAFLLLKFLCLQAEGAAKRAEEVGFIDLAHFPELPMPEILHGLQDQAISILTEVGEANKTKQMDPENQNLCLLLVQIMEMALYLELCVLHICGIRPVLGRVDDFSKELKPFIKATSGHEFLEPSLDSLKRIVSVVHPGLLQTDGLL